MLQRQRSQEALKKDGGRYSKLESLWAALEGGGGTEGVQAGDVRLISLNWLIALAERGGTLPRRQDCPEEAFLGVARLRRIAAGSRLAFDADAVIKAVGESNMKPLLKAIANVLATLFRLRRNVDNLAPILAVSFVLRVRTKNLPTPPRVLR